MQSLRLKAPKSSLYEMKNRHSTATIFDNLEPPNLKSYKRKPPPKKKWPASNETIQTRTHRKKL